MVHECKKKNSKFCWINYVVGSVVGNITIPERKIPAQISSVADCFRASSSRNWTEQR